MTGAPLRVGLALLAALALTFSAGGQLAKHLGAWSLAPAFGLYFLAAWRLDRVERLLRGRAAFAGVLLVAALCLAFIVVFPLANSGAFGPGSDRDEALNLAVAALFSGGEIYSQTTYLDNPITPMPGAILLAAPFAALGEAAWQNLLWLPVLALVAASLLGRAAAAYLGLFVAANPGFLQDFLTGGDYAANAVYVTAALLLALRLANSPAGAALGGAALGLTLLSRPVFLLALAVAGGCVWRRGGRAMAAPFAVAAVVVMAAVALPVFVREPSGLSMTHAQEVSGFSALVMAALAALALALSAPAFLRRLTLIDAVGLLALCLAVMLWAPALAKLPEVAPRLLDLALPPALIGGLWLTERLAARPAAPD